MSQNVKQTRRLNYIDALRGVGMALVVYHHFILMGMRDSGYVSLVREYTMFTMPLFFFISGFVGFRRKPLAGFGGSFKKKALGLLLPTVVIFLASMAYFRLDPAEWVFASYKNGYWFTWVLFCILVCWEVVDGAFEKVNLWWVALVAAALHVGSFKLNEGIPWVGLASANLICANFVYFVAGVAFRRNEVRLWPLLDNKYVSAAVVLLACLPMVVTVYWCFAFVCSIAQVLVLFKVFRHYSAFFDSRKCLAMATNTLGRHTLEIYFLHYFLLFKIDFVCPWLTALSNDYCFRGHSCVYLVEFVVVGAATMVVCGACMLLCKIVKPFPLLDKLLFGFTR